MAKWTSPRNLRAHDRIKIQDGSTVTILSTETSFLSVRDNKVPAITVLGRRDSSNVEYRAVIPDGQKVKKII